MARREDPIGWPAAPWGWALAGVLLGLAAALLLFVPATWMSALVANASGGRVVLAQARGTAWNGSAQLLLTGGEGSRDVAALPSRLGWRVRPGWSGGLRIALESACCTTAPLDLHLEPRWRGAALRLGNGSSAWPAALLSGLGTPWNTLQVDGQLQLLTQDLSVEWIEGRLAIAGRAELQAQGISSRLSTLRPMGSYRMTLQGGAAPALLLDTLDGALRLSGSGQWVGSRLRFNGEASAAPEREAALANLLNIIGRRSGARSLITIG